MTHAKGPSIYSTVGVNHWKCWACGEVVERHTQHLCLGMPAESSSFARVTTLPDGSAARKKFPLHRGLFRYFPAALAGVAAVSKHGNDKHNPGDDYMHHARSKSMDHADCILRHLMDLEERDGLDENGIPQVAYIAWRALALAQEWYEKNEGAPVAPAATFARNEND